MARRAHASAGIVVAGTCLALAACGTAGINGTRQLVLACRFRQRVQPGAVILAARRTLRPCRARTASRRLPVRDTASGRRRTRPARSAFQGLLVVVCRRCGNHRIETSVYTSAALARECFAQQRQSVGQGSSSRPIPDLGPSAESVALPKAGTVDAILLRGAKWIVVGIVWPPAVKHPERAVRLLRDAAANFGSYSNTPQQEC